MSRAAESPEHCLYLHLVPWLLPMEPGVPSFQKVRGLVECPYPLNPSSGTVAGLQPNK